MTKTLTALVALLFAAVAGLTAGLVHVSHEATQTTPVVNVQPQATPEPKGAGSDIGTLTVQVDTLNAELTAVKADLLKLEAACKLVAAEFRVAAPNLDCYLTAPH